MTKNFWNNWDFKTIIQIVIIIGGFVYTFATLKSEVNNMGEQRNKDVETVKMVREMDLKSINENMKEIKDVLKDIRDDLKTKRDK